MLSGGAEPMADFALGLSFSAAPESSDSTWWDQELCFCGFGVDETLPCWNLSELRRLDRERGARGTAAMTESVEFFSTSRTRHCVRRVQALADSVDMRMFAV
ncbi:hypothetical protein M427DRAFT_328246 [Gonapodya prolifera JEL478]|uniref:Uncharacterized protein n=1 Tax=Gonapodya prolifera (strain JEL478) TaxID=1344416 RepID=A0A139AE14_GONPJ|nr:hypothetical protein M427DRAFT_328246 [Gonapodya prolifera JEL478]|eukprot:KXS15066.1 hypothetical protein M427DRAFT_328246 [Gonapodya prolifera JEL478]